MLFFGQEESQWVMNNIEIQNDQSDPSEPDTAGIAVVKVKIWNNTLQNETQIVAKAAVEARFASQIDPTTGANNVAWFVYHLVSINQLIWWMKVARGNDSSCIPNLWDRRLQQYSRRC